MSTPEPDWSDRAAVLDYLVETGCHFAGSDRFDEVEGCVRTWGAR